MKRPAQLRLQALAGAAIALVAATAFTMRDDTTLRIRGRLGPTPGPNSDGHVEAKRQYLDRLASREPDRPAAGLVSFARLVSATEATAVARGMKATAAFVTFPQDEPDTLLLLRPLEVTVAERARELADVVRAEIVSLEAQLREAQGAEREDLTTSIADRQQALGRLKPDCPCVYAIAVQETTLGALRRVQQRDEVLLVDVPDPVVTDLAGWELSPILPS